MKAIWQGRTIAETDKPIHIEGHWYFPPEALNRQYFETTDKHTTCFWKGVATYYKIDVDGVINVDGAWYYPRLKPSAIEVTKKDFTNYVGFWHGVEIK